MMFRKKRLLLHYLICDRDAGKIIIKCMQQRGNRLAFDDCLKCFSLQRRGHKPLVVRLNRPQHLLCLLRILKFQCYRTHRFHNIPFICDIRIASTFCRNSFSLSNAIVAPAAILCPPPYPLSSIATVFIADPRSNPASTRF